MYLRTTRRRNKDGSVVEYYQLAHNQRHPETKHPVAQVVHNFGRSDQLDRDELVRLCRSIARVCGLSVLDPVVRQTELPELGDKPGLPEGLRLLGTKQLGVVWVVEALWERLGIGTTLRDVCRRGGCKVPYERALLAMVANRLCEPESKLGVWDRWQRTVHLPSLEGVRLAHMYEAMDVLYDHAEEIERTVFFQTADLLNLEVDLVFYDSTTAAFSIDEADGDSEDGDVGLRQFGEAKDGAWNPQVVVALAVTREGLPVRSWVFPGNTADVTTVKRVKQDLKGWKLGRALFVSDSGMNSEDNRRELARACGKYLLATRVGSVKEVKEDVLSRPGRYRQISDNLKAKEVVIGKGERRRRYVVCYNPLEEQRKRAHRAQVLEELQRELVRHRSNDATQKWAITLLASRRYGRYLRMGRDGQLEINASAVKAAERYDGKWVLLTNDDTLTLEDTAMGYKSLQVIERCFRALKRTRIQMTPMYHWLPTRIEAHVKICVLALLVSRTAELAAGRPWEKLRRELKRLTATEFAAESYHFSQRNELDRGLAGVLQSLDIKAPKAVLAVSPAPSGE